VLRHDLAGPHSEALGERARAALPGGNTRTTVFVPPQPPYAASGRGHVITDADGHEVIDLQANQSALVHGHAHPAIVTAIAGGLQDGLCFGMPTESEVKLAEHLLARIPSVQRLRFTNSGTEAVMTAVRTARAFTGRDAILRFEGCYHGAFDAVMSGSRGVPMSVDGDVIVVPWGDVAALENALEEHGDRIACVLVDLMPMRGGLHQAQPSFARALRSGTRECGALLLVDEVITFRLGHGGLAAAMGVEPDLITLGKTIGGGLPVGAFGGRADVMDVLDPRAAGFVEHGGTFTANPTVMRAGLVGLELLDERAINRINHLGSRLRGSLRELGYWVNGYGSLSRVLVEDADGFWWRMYKAGVLISRNGFACVATTMDEQTIDDVVAIFADCK
jgi:glutamate-1-semialdehyde 2,1-aminomutase